MSEAIRQSNTRVDWIESSVSIQSARGAQLCLHKVITQNRSTVSEKAPVILAHGTFSNHRTCGALARYLASSGRDCWLIDYEGHGSSESLQTAVSFESLFLSGTASAINHITQLTGNKPHWVGHSGGGLAALMAMAREPEIAHQLRSLVMLGSQACHAGHTLSNRVLLRLSLILTKVLGHVPGTRLGLGPEDELATVMVQWFRWNLKAQWLGEDGFDYLHALQHHRLLGSLRVLSMAGSADWYIAPPAACKKLYDLLPGTDKQWFECGVAHGFGVDFSHARLISSRAAARDIWPRVAHWLSETETA